MMRRFRTPLAWLILSEQRGRFALAVVRIGFAVLLMFSQLGFLNGVFDSQTSIVHHLHGDLFIINRNRYSLVIVHEKFARRRLWQVLDVPGVKAAYPLYVEDTASRVRDPADGRHCTLRVMAFNPRDPVFATPAIENHRSDLERADTVLVDTRGREFFATLVPGTEAELNDRRLVVLANFQIGADFQYDGNMVMGEANFFRFFPRRQPGDVDIGLLDLCDGADPAAVAEAASRILPDDVLVLTRAEVIDRERAYWARSTPTGIVFGLGMVVGFVVGVITCYQILFNDVTDNLPRFATLKALGYGNGFLRRVVSAEAVYLAILGFFPGLFAAQGLYMVLQEKTLIPMRLTPGRIALVAILTILMCQLAALFAVRKALKADPAELF